MLPLEKMQAEREGRPHISRALGAGVGWRDGLQEQLFWSLPRLCSWQTFYKHDEPLPPPRFLLGRNKRDQDSPGTTRTLGTGGSWGAGTWYGSQGLVLPPRF